MNTEIKGHRKNLMLKQDRLTFLRATMTTKYKFIYFEESAELVNNKKVWLCRNNKTKSILAKIFYYKPWKEYCFTQFESGVIFNDGCLADTINFIKQLNKGL